LLQFLSKLGSWPIIEVSGYCFCFIYLRIGPTLKIGAGCQDLTIAPVFAKFISLLGVGKRNLKLVKQTLLVVKTWGNKGECCCGEENALR
jgi:hypothetical protein